MNMHDNVPLGHLNVHTGCPTKLYTLLFCKFLGFQGVYKPHLGHFWTALSVQILKIPKLLLKYWKKVISKINIFCFITKSRTQTLKITGEHSRVPMITQDCPWTLKTAHETSWAMLSMVQGHYEWYVVPRHYAHECLSALMRAVCAMVQWSWVLIVVYSGSWVLKRGHAASVVLMIAIGAMLPYSWGLMNIHKHS